MAAPTQSGSAAQVPASACKEHYRASEATVTKFLSAMRVQWPPWPKVIDLAQIFTFKKLNMLQLGRL